MKEEAETEETTGGALSAAELWGERAESIVRYVTQSGKPQPLTALGAFMARKGWQLPMVSCVLEYIEKAKLLSRFETSSGAVAYKLPMTRVTESGDEYVTGAIEKATETAAAKQAQAVRAQRIREFATRKKTPPAPVPSIGGWRARNKVAAPAVAAEADSAPAVEPEPVPAPPEPTPLPEAPAEPVVEEEATVKTAPSNEDVIDSNEAAAILGVHRTSIAKIVRAGKLKPVTEGRGRAPATFRRGDVLAATTATEAKDPAPKQRRPPKTAKAAPAVEQVKHAKFPRAPKPAAVSPAAPAGLDKVRLLISCVDAGIFSRDDAWERLRTLVAA